MTQIPSGGSIGLKNAACPQKIYIYIVSGNDNNYTAMNGWALKILSNVKATEHTNSHTVWFYLYEMSRRGKSTEVESRLVSARI